MKQLSRRILLANTFGSLGYLTCLFLWGWTGILFLPMLFENEYIEQLVLPSQSETIVAPSPTMEASPALAFFALAVTAVVIVATIVVLLKAPVTIAKTGQTVTTRAATSALPLLTKGQPLPPAKKRRLTANLVKLAKLVLILLPVGVGFIGTVIELPLPFDVSILISSTLALIAIMWFSLQYITARLLAIDVKLLV